ncbi:hypothetical protein PFLUV_G00266740 [Perca fluviatilis]|uniref:Uncharacterized protein n=1 Tax=Perca fluviatilis TaxID=8168 RepID=A0A6A5E2M6_PERFL|nr:hypothetical protein PFLUV_G00266740 [Perca fluviatilis]
MWMYSSTLCPVRSPRQLCRRPVCGSWRRRTTMPPPVWRRWFTAAICCWRRSRAPWLTSPSLSSAPATDHLTSPHQPNPDPAVCKTHFWTIFSHFPSPHFDSWFLPSDISCKPQNTRNAEFFCEGNARCHTVSETSFGCLTAMFFYTAATGLQANAEKCVKTLDAC